tara:strand:- start:241 stop:444 length:204 start_codon:yes stop_codon:yes gene_type:complete
MSIQKELDKLETEIEKLKSNELEIEEQINIYKDALKQINKTKKTISSLKNEISIINKTNDNTSNNTN